MPRVGTAGRRRVVHGVVAAALCLMLWGPPATAWGWHLDQPLYGVVSVERDSEDTGAASFVVWERAAAVTTGYYAAGTYDETTGAGFFTGSGVSSFPVAVDGESLGFSFQWSSYGMVTGPFRYGVKHVFFGQPSSMQVYWNSPGPVYYAARTGGPATVVPTVTIDSTVAVSQAASLSVAGTLPVDVVSVWNTGADAGVFLLMLLGVLAGMVMGRGAFRHTD